MVIDFDFLDHNDGSVIEIQHTGSYESAITAEGIILGVADGIKVLPIKEREEYEPFIDIPRKRQFVPRTIREKVKETFFAILGISVFFGILFGIVAIISLFIPTADLKINKDALAKILHSELPSISAQSVNIIIEKIELNESEGKDAPVLTIIGIVVSVFFLFLILYGLWSSDRYPFPNTLYVNANKEIEKVTQPLEPIAR